MSESRLTPERAFSDPPLTIAAPHSFTFAPDGSKLTFLQTSQDDRERMDLWCYDFDRGEERRLLDARSQGASIGDVTKLTAAERAERERRRQFAFGITQYFWHPHDALLLVPIDGHAYLVDVGTNEPQWQQLTPDGTRQSGFQFSPLGNYVSYVREGDLYAVSVASGSEQRLTADASTTVSNGLPDFLAAEEMHRFRGHWWAPDETAIAYGKVDEQCVGESSRIEIDARGTRTVTQRYPYAGAVNPDVALHEIQLATGNDRVLWESSQALPYLARVVYCDDGLLIQVQDRLQQHLRLQRWVGETWETLFEDQSDTWINLADDPTPVDGAIVVTTEDLGTRRAVLLRDGVAASLDGPTHINKVLHANAERVLVSGWADSPIENHLFRIEMDGSGHRRITSDPGWHEVTVDEAGERFVDRFTNEHTPGRISIGSLTGASDDQPQTTLFVEDVEREHPYFPYLAEHAYPEFGEIAAEDGQTMHYRLTPPRRIEGEHPVVVYVYGGPGAQKVRREWGATLLQLFAEHGFGVLELDNRGSTNRGSRFEAPLFRAMGQSEVRDQVRGLAVLADTAWADPNRVGVFGHSYGGYMTLMCLCQAGAHFKGGVAVAPVCDWRLYDTHYTERYMGLPDDEADAYERGNVLSHIDRLERPLLLMHGMADDNVLFTHSTMLMDALQRKGKRFELMTYPGAKHSMQERHVSIHRFDTILDFFSRVL
jgi:dipeptidyl-peptidase-4